jgi:hypothetical protein
MKTTAMILCLCLLLSGTVLAQTTRPIDNPHDLTVFGYTAEFTPSYFTIDNEGNLDVVSTQGDLYRLYPRPRLGEVNGKLETAELTQAQKEKRDRKGLVLEQAFDKLINKSFNDFLTFLEASEEVVEPKIVSSDCVKIIFEDGDFEEVTIHASEVNSQNIEPWLSSQEFWMKKFQDALNAGSTVWFGTSTFQQRKYSPEVLQLYRDGIAAHRQGLELTPEQSLTPASHEGVKYDALR